MDVLFIYCYNSETSLTWLAYCCPKSSSAMKLTGHYGRHGQIVSIRVQLTVHNTSLCPWWTPTYLLSNKDVSTTLRNDDVCSTSCTHQQDLQHQHYRRNNNNTDNKQQHFFPWFGQPSISAIILLSIMVRLCSTCLSAVTTIGVASGEKIFI